MTDDPAVPARVPSPAMDPRTGAAPDDRASASRAPAATWSSGDGSGPRPPLVLRRGPVEVVVARSPLAITVRRDGRHVLGPIRGWAREGTVHDRFVRVTEGVVARERLGVVDEVETATPVADVPGDRDGLLLALHWASGARGTLRISVEGEVVAIDLDVDGPALRVGARWPVPAEADSGARTTRLVGLGARHHHEVDHAGRRIQLGADRRYLGPGCTDAMAAVGGVPQGDYAPIPFLQSDAGWAAWLDTAGNGTRFDLDEGRVEPSVRRSSGPLRLRLAVAPRPVSRLRAFARATGRPALLPAWGYGFWKSRDVHEHQDVVEEDVHGCRWHGIPLDAIVLDSPWATNYNTWVPNPHQLPDFTGMVRRFLDDGVRTVVWVTPWVNVDSRGGQTPPDPASVRSHEGPAETYDEGAAVGAYVQDADGDPFLARWWMGRGSPLDFCGPGEAWWRAQCEELLCLGVRGIKADDGEGYYLPEDVRFADGSTGATRAWHWGDDYRRSMHRALEGVHPGDGVLFGRSGWSGQQATGILWGGDQTSDWWSLRALVAATISGAHSGVSNWSHDIGGYLGDDGVRRCPPELLVRWAQLGCFTPLMQAHARLEQEPWSYDAATLDRFRGAVLLHEMLVPYVRAAARTAARSGVPIVRPLAWLDPDDDRLWSAPDVFAYGPSLVVAPVVAEGVREREVPLPRGRWVEAWSGEEVEGGRTVRAPAPLDHLPVWVRAGSVVVSHPADHVARGLGDVPDADRPYVATLWGEPTHGRARAALPDGSAVRWARGRWALPPDRRVRTVER